MADHIERELRMRGESEVRSEVIGELVMNHLEKTDQIAYVRFASVYRQFADVNNFMQELQRIINNNEIRNGVTPSMKIRKRDGRIVAFDDSKITDAIFAAAQAVGGADREMAVEITLCVLKCLKAENKEIVDVEHVQDIVEKVLIKKGHAKTAKSYILYRAKRTDIRNARSELMDTVAEILKETDRDNANISNSPSAKCCNCIGCQPRILFEPCYSGRNGGGA